MIASVSSIVIAALQRALLLGSVDRMIPTCALLERQASVAATPGLRRQGSRAGHGIDAALLQGLAEAVREPGNSQAVSFVTFCLPAVASMADLGLSRQFTLESQSRAIDACDDVAELRRIAKALLSAWHMQSDMTRHYGAQALGMSSPFSTR